jgi:hypothetical protein
VTTVVFGVRLLAAGLFLAYSLTIQPEPRWMAGVAVGALAVCYVMAFGVGDGLRTGSWAAGFGWLAYTVLGGAGTVVAIARLWAMQHQPNMPWPQARMLTAGMALLMLELAYLALGALIVLAHTKALRLREVTEPDLADAGQATSVP